MVDRSHKGMNVSKDNKNPNDSQINRSILSENPRQADKVTPNNRSLVSEVPKQVKLIDKLNANDKSNLAEKPKNNEKLDVDRSKISENPKFSEKSLKSESSPNKSFQNEANKILNKSNLNERSMNKSRISQRPEEIEKSRKKEISSQINERSNISDKSRLLDRSRVDQSRIERSSQHPSFTEYKIDKIISKYLITSNIVFDLYNGVLEDVDETIEVYLCIIKMVDFDYKIITDLTTYINGIETTFQKIITNLFMKRIGYCQFLNKFCLIYYKSNNTNLTIEKLGINDLKDPKQLAKSLCWFKSLIESINTCHDKEIKISLLHPSLLFIDSSGIKMIDYIFPLMLKNYDFNNNLDIAIFFGYYDIMKVNEIFNGLNDKKLSFKNDIIMFCEILNYFYSNKPELSFSTFIYDIEKDFLLKNTKFQNFVKSNEIKEVKNYILEVLSINYFEIKYVKEALYMYTEMMNTVISMVNCEGKGCKEESKLMNFECFHLLCNKCASKHLCSNTKKSKNEIDSEYILFKNKIEELKFQASKITLPRQNFSNYFTKNIEPSFIRINEMHKKYEIFLSANEQKLNHMIEVVENILYNKKLNEHQRIIKFKDNLKNDLKEIVTDVQENLHKQNEKYKKEQKEQKAEDMNNSKASRVSQKKKSIYEGILEKNIKHYDKLFDVFNQLNVLINNYEDYLGAEKDLKMHLNYNINIKFLLGKIYDKSVEFLKELKMNHYSKFLIETKCFTEKLLDSYVPFAEFEHLNILEELKNEENSFIGTVELKQNIVIIYDIHANTDGSKQSLNEKKIKLDFEESIHPKYIIPLCRWVNLKTKMIISGGIYKNSEGKEITVKNVYYIDYEADQETLVRNVYKLPDMYVERDQHCFITVNDFFLISIGGSKTPTCEMFNFLTNEWSILPNLDCPRYNCSAYVHNNLEIYLFFGLIGPPQEKNLVYSDSILRLKLYSSSNKELYWDNIKYKGEKINICLNGIIAINDKTVYILGGRIPGENNYSNLNYTFDPELQTISQSDVVLQKKLCFLECNFLKAKHEEYSYALYSSDFHLVKLKF